MSDLELIDAVAHVTGEDAHEIRRRGFVLTGPEDSGPIPATVRRHGLQQMVRTCDSTG
jgi:xanthine dehydrogenase molybdopterin-binding subunit B